MSTHRLVNILLFSFILAIMAAAQIFLDGPTDTDAAQAQAQSLQDAQKTAHTALRLAKARQAAGVAL